MCLLCAPQCGNAVRWYVPLVEKGYILHLPIVALSTRSVVLLFLVNNLCFSGIQLNPGSLGLQSNRKYTGVWGECCHTSDNRILKFYSWMWNVHWLQNHSPFVRILLKNFAIRIKISNNGFRNSNWYRQKESTRWDRYNIQIIASEFNSTQAICRIRSAPYVISGMLKFHIL